MFEGAQVMLQMAPATFGLVIAYFFPGVIAVYAVRYSSIRLDRLLASIEQGENVIGPAVILIIAALTAGLLLSCVRTFTLEPVFRRLGAREPEVDYSCLDSEQAMRRFQEIIDNVYRYYQFYANTLIALLLLLMLRHSVGGACLDGLRAFSLFFMMLVAAVTLFFAAKAQWGDLVNALDQLTIAKEDDSGEGKGSGKEAKG